MECIIITVLDKRTSTTWKLFRKIQSMVMRQYLYMIKTFLCFHLKDINSTPLSTKRKKQQQSKIVLFTYNSIRHHQTCLYFLKYSMFIDIIKNTTVIFNISISTNSCRDIQCVISYKCRTN